MKKLFLFYIFICLNFYSNAQKAVTELTIQELEAKLKEAETSSNKDDVNYYTKAISLRKNIEVAVKNEDYNKANSLKSELKNLKKGSNDDEKSKLEAELKKAVDSEDYAKAAELKKKLNNTENQNSETTSEVNIPEVEFVNQIYLWNKNDNSMNLLELDVPTVKTQVAVGYGYSQASSYWAIPGIKSDFVINSMENKSFVLRTSPGVNPYEMFRLVQFKILGKKDPCRHMAAYVSSSGAWVGSSTTEKRDGDVAFSFKKLKDNYYEVVLNQGISSGEYTFYGLNKMFSFSLATSVNASARVAQNNSGSNSGYGDPNPNANKNNGQSNSGNSGGFGTTAYNKKDIYTIPSITFMGLDLSLMTYISYNKVGLEQKNEKSLDELTKNYNAEMNQGRVRMWYGKQNVNIDKSMSYAFHQYMKPNWISNQTQFITLETIQQHLNNYKTSGQGIGLVVIPEMFNEITKMSNIYFVWFDTDTKAIIHTQQTFARPGGGVSIAGIWDVALIDATKNYVDQYYKKEKRLN